MSTHKIHVLFLTPGFPKDEGDTACVTGIQKFLRSFHTNKSDYLLTVITLQYPAKRGVYEWNGIKVYALGGPEKMSIRKVLFWRKVYRLFHQIHFENPVDIIHSYWLGECALLAQRFQRKTKVKHLCTVMGLEAAKRNQYLKLIKLKGLNLVCQSSFQLEKLNVNQKIQENHIIPFGIDEQDFPSLTSRERDVDLLFVGGINENKNLTGFLEIASKLLPRFRKLKIEIIGDNFLDTTVDDLIKQYGLENNTSYLGKVVNSVVLDRMSHSKIFVHTSFFEAGAIVFMEALMQGMHIVSRDVGLVAKSAKWKIASTNSEFIGHIESWLISDLIFDRHCLYPIEKTVDNYQELYDKILTE